MDRVSDLLQRAAAQGRVACVDAHRIAAEAGLTPAALGTLVDSETKLRFDRCQLGLFGYGEKGTPGYKIVVTADYSPPEIVAAIAERTVDGRISCLALWEIAAHFRYPRLGIANIAQAQGLKIKPCQLGCF